MEGGMMSMRACQTFVNDHTEGPLPFGVQKNRPALCFVINSQRCLYDVGGTTRRPIGVTPNLPSPTDAFQEQSYMNCVLHSCGYTPAHSKQQELQADWNAYRDMLRKTHVILIPSKNKRGPFLQRMLVQIERVPGYFVIVNPDYRGFEGAVALLPSKDLVPSGSLDASWIQAPQIKERDGDYFIGNNRVRTVRRLDKDEWNQCIEQLRAFIDELFA